MARRPGWGGIIGGGPGRDHGNDEYLTFTPVDEPDRLVVFETDGTTVTAFRAGEAAWATLVEGCA